MNSKHVTLALIATFVFSPSAFAQSAHEDLLCEAAKSNQVIEIVYDKDASKGCLPRLVDVHQLAIGNNGKLYMHGWQSRGCTKGRDFASKRIFRLDKVKSVTPIDGDFSEKSQATKNEGWNGCIGNNCFIKEMICE